jgi:hypothetical protein
MTASPPISVRATERKRRNRRQVVWALGCATVAVSLMTWYDIAIRDYSYINRAPSAGYYLTADAQAATLPDDYSGVTLWQGSLQPDPVTGVRRNGDFPSPVTFAQREVDLVVELPFLPTGDKAERAAIHTLTGIAKAWGAQNNMVSDLILDVRRMEATGDQLLGFIEKLREAQALNYRVALLVDPLSSTGPISGETAAERYNLLSHLAGLFIFLPQDNALTAVETAEAYEYPYSLIVPEGVEINDALREATARAKYFRDFVYAAPQAKTAQ